MRKKVEIYKDKKGEYRWRLISSRRIIAESAEGYTKKASAKAGLFAVVKALSQGATPLVDLTLKVRTAK